MSARVYIGRLSYRATERDIERFFRGYGKVVDIVLKNGFGFVEFRDPRDADDAVYDLNGKDLCGERVVLEFSRKGPRSGGFDRFPPPRRNESRYGPPVQTRHRLIVENLSSRVSWQDLKDMMRSAGEVTYADAHKEHPNEGVVCFSSHDGLERAIEKMQGKEVNGRKLKLIDDSEPNRGGRRSRSQTRSRTRSRSRSETRSRSRSRSSRRSSRSRSSHSKSRSRSPPPKKDKTRSRSRSRDSSRSSSRSEERSKSKSLEKSPAKNGADEQMNENEHSRSATPEE